MAIVMDKELTFYPQTGRARDLSYSEYSSCDRSIHLLAQENSGVPYDFLLRAYRESVSAYLSSADLLPPVDFLKELARRFDALSAGSSLPTDYWTQVGIHVVLRCVGAAYVLTTREREVLVHAGGRMLPVAESMPEAAGRVRLDEGDVQAELFPKRLSDVASAFRIDLASLRGKDLVLGCSQGDAAAVLQGLSGSVWVDEGEGADGRASRRSIVTEAVSRKVLAVRFAHAAGECDGASAAHAGRTGRRQVRIRALRRAVVPAAAIAAAVVIAVLWRRESAGPERVGSAQVSRPDVTVKESRDATAPSEGRSEKAAAPKRSVKLTEKWRTRYKNEVTSSPVLFEKTVIFGCRDGGVYALDRDTGAQVWKFVATAGVGSSLVIWRDRVVFGDYNGSVFAVDARTGDRIWTRKLPARVVSSPAAAQDRLVVGCYDGRAYCLSAEDGGLLWTAKTGGRIRGSAAASDEAFFVPSHDGFIYALAALTGEVKWRAGLGGAVSASPAFEDGMLVVGGPDGKIRCFDAESGAIVWTFLAGAAVDSRAVIADGKVFTGANDGQLYSVTLEGGAEVWKRSTGRAVLGRPFVRDGTVYAGSYDSGLYAIDVSTGRVLGRFDAGAAVYSSPAVDGKRVYFGTNGGDFICLDAGGEGTT